MKNLLFSLLALLSLNVQAYDFAGEIKQTSGDPVTITIYPSNQAPYIYECPQEKRILGLQTISTFNLDLEEDIYYTLVFECGDIDKFVYVDTHDIRSNNNLQCNIAEMDAVMYFDPVDGRANATYMDVEYIDWLCSHFPTIRNYNIELLERGEDLVECPKMNGELNYLGMN